MKSKQESTASPIIVPVAAMSADILGLPEKFEVNKLLRIPKFSCYTYTNFLF
jgi:hypothetical protein